MFSDPLGTGPGVTTQDGYPAVVVGRDGYWYLGDDFRLKCETTVPLSMIVRQLNRLDDALRASGRTLIVVEAPDKSTMMPEHLPAETPGKACARARSAATRRAMHRVPAFLDLRPGLREAAADSPWPMYMPKDTHWDGPGAAEMVRQIVLRTDPAVAATFAPRDAGAARPGDSVRPAVPAGKPGALPIRCLPRGANARQRRIVRGHAPRPGR